MANRKKSSKFALCADVGGTKTEVAVFYLKKNRPEAVFINRYQSSKIKNFSEIVNEVASEAKKLYNIRIDFGCIAAAGPVSFDGKRVKMTNLNLEINADKIKKNTPIKKIMIVNDFAAISNGLKYLEKNDLIELTHKNRPKKREKNSALVVGPGTGFGASFKVGESIMTSESGHTIFNSVDEIEHEMFEYLKRDVCYGAAPEYEDVVSGRGLVNIYNFLQKINFVPQVGHIKHEIGRGERIEEKISRHALEGKDRTCEKSLDLFIKFYARITKNLVLSLLPSEVYLAGGISPKIAGKLKEGIFIDEFERSNKMSEILKNTPVFLIMNPRAGLFGAAGFAFNL